MAIQSLGADGSTVVAADPLFQASRTSLRPPQCLAWHSISVPTGALTVVSAGGAIFSLRNAGTNLLAVRRCGVGFVCTTGFGAAQLFALQLIAARSFTASDSGGTAIPVSGNTNKHRTSLAQPSNIDCRVSTTGALTGGTKTADTYAMGSAAGYALTSGGIVIAPTLDNLLAHNSSDFPLILAANEGLNIVMQTTMGATGVGTAFINIEFAEMASY